MKQIILSCCLFFSLFSSCKKSELEKGGDYNFDTFGITLPQGWSGKPLQGIDSYVGRITNGKDTLFFDYGMYSGSFDYLSDADYVKTSRKINGKNAVVVRPRKVGNGILGVRIATGEYQSLKITGRSKEEGVVLKMFDSIRIK